MYAVGECISDRGPGPIHSFSCHEWIWVFDLYGFTVVILNQITF